MAHADDRDAGRWDGRRRRRFNIMSGQYHFLYNHNLYNFENNHRKRKTQDVLSNSCLFVVLILEFCVIKFDQLWKFYVGTSNEKNRGHWKKSKESVTNTK